MKQLLVVLCGIALVTGCDSKLLESLPNVKTDHSTGSAVVSIVTKQQQTTQATVSDINRMEIRLSSGGLATPKLKNLDSAAIAAGNPSAAFDEIPVGPANFTVTAFDNTNLNIGQATASVQIQEAQTASVTMTLKLAPTYVADNAIGGAAAQIVLVDGDVIKLAPQVEGSYDPKIDAAIQAPVSVSSTAGASGPDMIGLNMRLSLEDASGNYFSWNKGEIIVDYQIYEVSSTYANEGKTLLLSGQTTFLPSTSSRYLETPRKAITNTRWAVTEAVIRLPNGKVLYDKDVYGWVLQSKTSNI